MEGFNIPAGRLVRKSPPPSIFAAFRDGSSLRDALNCTNITSTGSDLPFAWLKPFDLSCTHSEAHPILRENEAICLTKINK